MLPVDFGCDHHGNEELHGDEAGTACVPAKRPYETRAMLMIRY